MTGAGEPAYRGGQLYHALYAERRFDFAAMTNLPAPLRARLAAESEIGMPRIVRRYRSADGSVRYLLELPLSGSAAGANVGPPKQTRVEAVFMPTQVE